MSDPTKQFGDGFEQYDEVAEPVFRAYRNIISHWIQPLAEGWFNLMGWLLIISTLSFAAQQLKDPILYTLVWISMFALWAHLTAYQGKLFVLFFPSDKVSEMFRGKYLRLWLFVRLLGTVLTVFVIWLAWRFATAFSALLNG